jgi:hypothetical protein
MQQSVRAQTCALLVGLGAFGISSASGAPILYEGFDYTVGQPLENQVNNGVTGGAQDWDRAGSSATAAPSITSGSLSYPVGFQPAPTGNKITLGGTVTTRAERLNFPVVTSGTVYFSLLFNPENIDGQFVSPGPATAAGVFSFAFNNGNADAGTNTAPTIIGTRIQIRRDPSEAGVQDGTLFNIGTLNSSGTTDWNATQYAEGSTLFIVGSYTFNGTLGTDNSDDVAKLWVNPDPATFDPSATTPTATVVGGDITNTGIQSIIVRQTGGEPTTLSIDEIRVGTEAADVIVAPEPSSLALIGVAAAGLLRRRSRRA